MKHTVCHYKMHIRQLYRINDTNEYQSDGAINNSNFSYSLAYLLFLRLSRPPDRFSIVGCESRRHLKVR